MEDDFELLSEALCELLERRLRETEPRHTPMERAIVREQNPIELPAALAYQLVDPQENSHGRRASKPLAKWLH